MPKLDPALAARIKSVCDHGERLASAGEYSFAISKYLEALTLIPDPKHTYMAATWIHAAVGETYWLMHNYKKAGVSFLTASRSAGGAEQSTVNLRLGECLFECGEIILAQEFLLKAFAIDGESAFANEDEKYFALIRKDALGKDEPVMEVEPDNEEEDDIDLDEDFSLLSHLIGSSETEIEELYPPETSDYRYNDELDSGYSVPEMPVQLLPQPDEESIPIDEGFFKKAVNLIKIILNIK